MASGMSPQGLLKILRQKIEALRHISPHLARSFDSLDFLAGGSPVNPGTLCPQAVSATANAEDVIGRLAVLEAALTRAVEYERLGLGQSTAEIEDLMSRSELDFASQVRLIYFFSLAHEGVWEILAKVSPPATAASAQDPVIRALKRLRDFQDADELEYLRPTHQRALEQSRRAPLGFCRLVLEEAACSARDSAAGRRADLAYIDRLLNDPFLAISSPRHYADLRSRVKLYIAQHSALSGDGENPRPCLRQGAALLIHGARESELQACHFETQGLVELRDGGLDDALPFFTHSHVLLADSAWSERRSEALVKYALALSAGSRRHHRADLLLESSLNLIKNLEPRLEAGPRLRLRHFSALVDLRRARGFERHPLSRLSDGISLHIEDIRRRVQEWVAALSPTHLNRALTRLHEMGPLYDQHAPPGLRLHRSLLLGQSLLLRRPDLALIYLLDAKSGFDKAGLGRLATVACREAVTCLALLHRDSACIRVLDELCAGSEDEKSPEHELLEDLSLLAGGLDSVKVTNAINADPFLSELLDMPCATQPCRSSASDSARASQETQETDGSGEPTDSGKELLARVS